MVKKWLTSKGLPYEEVNVEDHPERQAEVIELSGQLAVPVTVVTDAEKDHQDITIGWNPGKLASAVASMTPTNQAA
jgi:glutaredoxin